MPNEPADSNFKNKIKLKAYPTQEWGGLVWLYMGPADKMPELPQFEWARVPASQRHVSRTLQRTNFCQGLEGEFDNAHVSWLHHFMALEQLPTYLGTGLRITNGDGAPKFSVKNTKYGFMAGMRRNLPPDITKADVSYVTGLENEPEETGKYWWMLNQFMVPMYSLVAQPHFQRGGRFWVPIDDHHTQLFAVLYSPDRPFTEDEHASMANGAFFPPLRGPENRFQMPDGYVIDIPVPLAKWENDFLIDREMQRTVNFTGIYGINAQDRSIQETMQPTEGLTHGAVVDRTKEHLGTTDMPTIAARRILIKMARDLQKGIEPEAATNGGLYHIRAVPRISNCETLDEIMEEYGTESIIAQI
jgi:phenylpropionate dioxygenase-like ring-hydroxylating dioxygenase large terminal subunit